MKTKNLIDPEICAKIYPPATERAREIARGLGYAIGVHGSQQRDLDLIAAPWTEEACEPWDLANAIAIGLGWWLHPKKVEKPFGRISYLIYTHDHAHIDLSIMPKLK